MSRSPHAASGRTLAAFRIRRPPWAVRPAASSPALGFGWSCRRPAPTLGRARISCRERRTTDRPQSGGSRQTLPGKTPADWLGLRRPRCKGRPRRRTRASNRLVRAKSLSTPLIWTSGVSGDLRAQRADYPEDWMDEVQPGAADRFSELVATAERHAKPIRITSQVGWSEGTSPATTTPSFGSR